MAKPSPIAERMTFENAKDLLLQSQLDASNARLTQSYLRSELPASTTTNQYTFPLLVNQQGGSLFPTEQRLELQDAIVVSSIGIFTAVPSSATDTGFELLTYPDADVYTTAAQRRAVNTVYNGKLVATMNNSVIVPAWDTLRCRVAPWAQSDAASGQANSTDFSVDGFFPTEPNLVLSGGANYQLVLNLPSAMEAVVANQRLIVIVRGVLAQNVTSVR